MSVGAISPDLPLANAFDAGARAIHKAGPLALDFAAALLAAQALGSEPASPIQAIDGGPAIKTEASRSVAVAGGLRTTTITYTDGSSDTEVVAMADDRRDIAPIFLADIVRLPLQTFKANSDLEPEAGSDVSYATRLPWRTKTNGRAAAAAMMGGKDRAPATDNARPTQADWDEPRAGKLIDRLG
jgi:hypothetical protein